MRMGLRPPLLSLFKTRKTKIIMGHIDEMLVTKMAANTMNSRYLDFCGGFVGNLKTGTTITDAVADAGTGGDAAAILAATLVDGEIVACEHDGGAAGTLYLPKAVNGAYCAVEITGDIDEANALTFEARGAAVATSTAVLAKQLIGPLNEHGASAQTVETAGTAEAPTSVKLIYTAAAANTNFLGVGSVIQFYCPKDDQWLVRVTNIAEGDSSTGVFTVA